MIQKADYVTLTHALIGVVPSKSKQTTQQINQFDSKRGTSISTSINCQTPEVLVMRSLKSSTAAATTTLKGKRKHTQTKDYPDSPPATPPHNNNVKTTTAKNKIIDLNSPPAKRRRSSDRIANKTGKKRQSMEDDDGFVFTRAPKQKRKPAQPEPSSKPFVIDFTADVPVPCEWM